MSRNPFILLSLILLLNAVHAKDSSPEITTKIPSVSSEHKESASSNQQIPEVQNSDKQQPEVLHSDKQHSDLPHAEEKHSGVIHSDVIHSDVHHSKTHHTEKLDSEVQQTNQQQNEAHHADMQQNDAQRSDMQQNEAQQSEMQHTRKQYSTSLVPSGRQFQPPPYYPMLFQQPSGFEAIRRQFGGGLGSDLMMVGLISLPILGLLTMGSASIGNLFGLGSSSSSSKKSSSKRNKRSLKEKAADAVEYAKNLWNVMEQLEKAFEKYDLYQAECRLRVVCEAHHKDRRMGSWGQSILDLMRQQKELEGRELLPVSRFLFSNYAEAAQAGARNENCAQLYTGCPRHLSYYLSAKEDQLENEVEIGM